MATGAHLGLVQAHEWTDDALDDLDGAPEQAAESAVGARNYHADFPAFDGVLTVGAGSGLLVPSQHLAPVGSIDPSRACARGRLGTYQPTSSDLPEPANTNDPDEGRPIRTKRCWKLRKPIRSDLRRRTTTLAISGALYEQGRRAFGNAWALGHPLDALVNLRPRIMDSLSPEEREAWFKRQVHKVRTTYAANDNLPEFAILWSRESKRVGGERKPEGVGEHLHMLLATGGNHERIDRYLRKHLSGPREVDVTVADGVARHLRNGQLGDAGTYVLKAVAPAYWRKYTQTPHRSSGPIYGQRVGWSKNLLDEKPIGRRARSRKA